jgi:hypothetical protein
MWYFCDDVDDDAGDRGGVTGVALLVTIEVVVVVW